MRSLVIALSISVLCLATSATAQDTVATTKITWMEGTTAKEKAFVNNVAAVVGTVTEVDVNVVGTYGPAGAEVRAVKIKIVEVFPGGNPTTIVEKVLVTSTDAAGGWTFKVDKNKFKKGETYTIQSFFKNGTNAEVEGTAVSLTFGGTEQSTDD